MCASVDNLFAGDTKFAERFPNAPAARGNKTSSLIEMVKDRPGHDWRYAVDASRIASELGFTPSNTFESGLQRTVDWMLANETWWRAIQDDSYRSWIEEQYDSK